jgi:hypothetical protein
MIKSTCIWHRGGFCIWDRGPHGEDVLCYGNKCDSYSRAITAGDYQRLDTDKAFSEEIERK